MAYLRGLPRILLACVALSLPATALAETYYVSQDGDDENPGTMALPWRTLTPIASVSSGDTVYIGDGTWAQPLLVPSGTEDERITVEAWPGQTPVIDTTGLDAHSVRLGAYADLIGITVINTLPVSDSLALVLLPEDGAVVRDCVLRGRDPTDLLPGDDRLRGTSFRQIAISIQGSDITVADNDIENIYYLGVAVRGGARRVHVSGNRIVNFGANAFDISAFGGVLRGVLIEGNHVEGSIMSDGLQTNASFGVPDMSELTDNRGIVVRGNVFRQFGENAIDLKGSSHIVVERNVFMRAENDNDGLDDGMPHAPWARASAGGTVMRGSNQSSGHVIIRHNVLFDNNGGIGMLASIPPEPLGWYAYNNTLAGNVRHAYESLSDEVGGSAGVRIAQNGAVFVNNIVVGQNRSCISYRSWPANGYFNHNLYYDAPNVAWVEDEGGKQDLQAWQAFLGSRSVGGQDLQALWADPLFVDAPLRPVGVAVDHDFNLDTLAPSPAIDAGQPLTRASSTGNGTLLPVEDVGFFFDGYGITDGDRIQVGESTFARIVAIDVENGTLELDAAISWSEGDPVSLPYTGDAPDIGACEVDLDSCWYSEVPDGPVDPTGGGSTSGTGTSSGTGSGGAGSGGTGTGGDVTVGGSATSGEGSGSATGGASSGAGAGGAPPVGCGCRLGAGRRTTPLLLLLAPLGPLLLRRRRL